ncbi:TWiK family of potassium channels protein 7 isoform X1 [Orussus abietinus]|uniref:TWiK family of potassium channels protein 7 isoform X1 n=1 Tax=Orussus abietinus TaxID=222816 RepID=UPI0006251453|nr:TWiK family of potassium channels protein 7 isoform X1 [Orussus abietinus]
MPEDPDDDDVIVCANGVSAAEGATRRQKPTQNGERADPRKSIGVQTASGVTYRLRVLPLLKDIVDEAESNTEPSKSIRVWKYLRFLGRVSLCQLGLLWLLSLWAVAGSAAFYATEGPREREQVLKLKDMQGDLAVGLAEELRGIETDNPDMLPRWNQKVQRYVAEHEKLLLAAVSSGYGEGGYGYDGGGGQLWTFPGCVLFASSLLTTLGFGAPVPRTTAGRTVAVIFAAVGIPAHFLLILNVGILLAVKLQAYAIKKRQLNGEEGESSESSSMSRWIKLVPFACIGGYYLLGILCFGAGRSRSLEDSLLFPLDFTAAGGLATTSGIVRIMYALYLEGAVTIAAIAVAVLRVSATQSLTNVGLKYGLLIPA